MTTKPSYRYELHVEVPATEAAVLADALEGENLSLRDRLGAATLHAQLASQEIAIDEEVAERWLEFQSDIEVLSTYLSVLIEGRELIVQRHAHGATVEGSLVLGRRGDTVRLPLDVAWDEPTQTVIDRGIDETKARALSLPDWVAGSLGVSSHSPRSSHTRRARMEAPSSR